MINCMNVCLGNDLITQVDKYAKKVGLRRDEAIQKLIEIAENQIPYSTVSEKYITIRVPVGPPPPPIFSVSSDPMIYGEDGTTWEIT